MVPLFKAENKSLVSRLIRLLIIGKFANNRIYRIDDF